MGVNGDMSTCRMAHHKQKFIVRFVHLTNRSQSTEANGVCSQAIYITRSIVQGSAIGPYAFITYVSDYKALDTVTVRSNMQTISVCWFLKILMFLLKVRLHISPHGLRATSLILILINAQS